MLVTIKLEILLIGWLRLHMMDQVMDTRISKGTNVGNVCGTFEIDGI